MSGSLRFAAGASDWRRVRRVYLLLVAGTIAVGLTVHWRGTALGPAARDVLGDALWAGMVVWWTGVIAPRARVGVRGVAALAVCFLVEISQGYHTPALDALRGTSLGHLVLGSGFDARDFAAYSIGVLAGGVADMLLVRPRVWRA